MLSRRRMILVIGGERGFLGGEIARILRGRRGVRVYTTSRNGGLSDSCLRYDFFDGTGGEALALSAFDTVIFAAHVEKHSDMPAVDRSMRRLLGLCSNAKFVYVSSDGVFDGEAGPYTERDAVNPRTAYGRNLVACEGLVRQRAAPGWLIVRPSYLYGITDDGRVDGRLHRCLAALDGEQETEFFSDMYKSPMEVREAASAIALAVGRGLSGILHVSGPRLSVFDFHVRAMRALGRDVRLLRPTSMSSRKDLEGFLLRDTSLDFSLMQRSLGLVPSTVEGSLCGKSVPGEKASSFCL
jgi:dTDP-4-dehydrorhamnose reductase